MHGESDSPLACAGVFGLRCSPNYAPARDHARGSGGWDEIWASVMVRGADMMVRRANLMELMDLTAKSA